MKGRNRLGVAVALGIGVTATLAFSQPKRPEGPGWFLQGSAPDPGGRLIVGPGGGIIGDPGRAGGRGASATVPACRHSPLCGNPLGGARSALQRVEWEQTMGFTYAYPVDLPEGGGGVSAVGIDSKGNLWVFQRDAVGKPQLFEFGPDRKLVRTVGGDVIGHQDKAHGMAIEAECKVWI